MLISYQNPVWNGYLADPFVLQHDGEYYAYGTGPARADGLVFTVLRSTDLVHWRECGGALVPPDPDGVAFWAPEVAMSNGRFYMYYSMADRSGDMSHRLRVAIAEHPAGPFVDAGHPLLPELGFTIDAHPFRDPKDGRWYLFFARDFFDGRPGTAIAAAPLADDMVTVDGPVTTILRASDDWQIYCRDRHYYGKIWDAWHTLEGPAVVAEGGRYYLLYSGGNWQSDGYGVGYAVADTALGPYHEPESGPAVLRGAGDCVIGPGHNSVAIGPDGRTRFIVYHAWDRDLTARRMCIDPLVFTAGRPECLGPTWTRQTAGIAESNQELSLA